MAGKNPGTDARREDIERAIKGDEEKSTPGRAPIAPGSGEPNIRDAIRRRMNELNKKESGR